MQQMSCRNCPVFDSVVKCTRFCRTTEWRDQQALHTLLQSTCSPLGRTLTGRTTGPLAASGSTEGMVVGTTLTDCPLSCMHANVVV